MIDLLQRLPHLILSRRLRRIVFIQTSWKKFINAVEINDLFDESPLEDRVWASLKRLQIATERQLPVKIGKVFYILDFAVYCVEGKLNIETYGDTWHTNRSGNEKDNVRDNALETKGWRILRFNTRHVNEDLEEYCIPTIVENINGLAAWMKHESYHARLDWIRPRLIN